MTGNVALSERSVFHGRMEQLSLELLADETYRRAGFDPSVPACTMRLASTLWRDPAAVQVAPATVLRRSSAVLARVHGQRRIYIRRGCAPQDFRFLVGHELAHAVYADEGVTFATEDAEESACDALAGALVAPRHAFRAAVAKLGDDVEQMALTFGTTESLCLLRLGEVTGRPLALVRPGRVRTRGEAAMPDDETIVRWARGKAPAGWVRSARVDGERRRVSLVFAA